MRTREEIRKDAMETMDAYGDSGYQEAYAFAIMAEVLLDIRELLQQPSNQSNL